MAKRTTTTTKATASGKRAAKPAAPESNGVRKQNGATGTESDATSPKKGTSGPKKKSVGSKPVPAPLAVSRAITPKKSAKPKATAPRRTSSRKASSAAPRAITSEDIALRAYFIAEKRHAEGRFGDPGSDWIEAERQLRDEAAVPA